MVQNLSLNATIPWWLVWKAFPAEVLAQLRLLAGGWYSAGTNAGGLRACASDYPPPAGVDIHFLEAKVLRGFKIDP